jgi:hypothetical protein
MTLQHCGGLRHSSLSYEAKRDALEQAAAADQRASDATRPQDRLLNEHQAQRWRALARSYQIVESLKQFLITFPKKGELRRLTQTERPVRASAFDGTQRIVLRVATLSTVLGRLKTCKVVR